MPGPTMVTVPNVVNQTQAAATTAIQGAQLVVGTVSQQSSTTVAAGSVISQSPAAGSLPGDRLRGVAGRSTGPVAVPNVVNLTQAAATTALTGAGLALGAVSQQSSATVPSGSVISQTPAAGTGVAAGSAVALVVSTGPVRRRPRPRRLRRRAVVVVVVAAAWVSAALRCSALLPRSPTGVASEPDRLSLIRGRRVTKW